MQLSKIKLAGFKSFVDPTTIDLPSHLVAIVGPNGCGKSNIIDAVSWVMGESSPKYLRGEALSDVIFNGSTARKPVGQASVELIFDNSDTTIGGEYAAFSEISIKRVLNRDSESVYYLNGTRCRKRDIVSIFLGTGLGPRSYSIIGQNMISRIAEAKPEELRTYLEEASGISKYKDRRHETELRIQHTKENLDRVLDVHVELEKQLSHLKNQANVAEKFKSLKQQERILRAELLAIQWRNVDSKLVEFTLQIHREETALESRQSELTGTSREIELMHHEQRVAQDALQEVQRRYYAVGNEITRIEQDVLHHQERQQQWEADLAQVENDWQTLRNQLNEMEQESREYDFEIQKIEPQLANENVEFAKIQQDLTDAEQAMQSWQVKWEDFNQHIAHANQSANVEKTNISHIENRVATLLKRQEQLQQDQTQFNFTGLHQEIDHFSQKAHELTESIEYHEKQLSKLREEIAALTSAQKDSTTNIDNVRGELQRLSGEQASLEALQQNALGTAENEATPWINKHHLEHASRLAQHIEVEKGWEYAVEKALGFSLQALCIENKDDVVKNLADFGSGKLCVFLTKSVTDVTDKQQNGKNEKNEKRLLHKIKSPWSLASLLSGVYIADSVEEAIALAEKLSDQESVITKEGVWANRSWIKMLKEEDVSAGVFQREQTLKSLAARKESLHQKITETEKDIETRREKMNALELQRDQIQKNYTEMQAQAAQINAQRMMKQERVAELKLQSERLLKEQEDCATQLKQSQNELIASRENYQHAMLEGEQREQVKETHLVERDQLREKLAALREQNQAKNEIVHALVIRLETAKSQKSSHKVNFERLQHQLTSLNDRKISLQSELVSMPPVETLKKSLSRALDKHVSIETELNSAKIAVESLEQEFKNLDSKRQILEKEVNKFRITLETLRVETQGWKVKAETIIEQLKESDQSLETILKELPQAVTLDEWQAKLDQVINRINRLGAINLTAIDEYATCSERKQYLDKQIEDLQAGLSTLEDAISQIDRETRSRFKETFDKVNTHFQTIFPTIFGGGKSYLELTEDDLLKAGVSVMACPPGKRNTSVYLLSGGEKTLTALALIFSIFQLNPAPFCLLDEVDAALDDANVVRFIRLVKEMALKTQFLFISHNKITIEMAQHLIGVTMNEPGVSRLVSVDIQKALSIAG